MKVEIYDPAMCCSSGLCGPTLDPVLVKMNDAVLALKKQGVQIERFNLAQQPKEFMANKSIAELLHKNGKKILPVVFVNGEVFSTGSYPAYEELCKALGIEPLKQGKPITLKVKVNLQEKV
ncbi:arsenical resistance operon trans-acting repressor ArsD [bacterium BMS3Abin08]|nr:arsenical resistance operon trans-acting repressor ArsD [bacterium BMS3Abin08]